MSDLRAQLVDEPTLIDLVQELRREVGLFDGAMPITPEQAWVEALSVVRQLRAGVCYRCMDRDSWRARRADV